MLYNNDLGLPELRDAKNHRKFYAMKVEKQLNCERPVLKLDVAVLSQLRTAVGFPTLIVAGRTDAFKFCVMQLLGPDLRSLMLVMPSKKFSPPTAYKVAIQTLDRLETLHDIGYLNRNEDGTLVRRRIYGPCVGTFPFAPLASATMRDQAPKDDLEGWFYMIMEIFIGFLPWYHEKMTLDHGLTREWKQYARGAFKSTMLRSLPCEFTPIFNNIITMRFEERPRYYFIRRMVSASAIRQGVDLNTPYDWQVVPALLSLVKETTEYDSPPTASVTNKLEDDHELATADICHLSNPMVSVATGVP
uniref:Protein kinase domain-containing protein n=1 Tax=Angiostrongylus cantonensis TaxID=6313 RepID=A0A0K0CU25_ANGCA